MTEERYAFITDVRDKKTIARSARHRVVGSKSRKCTMPSDYMTTKEKNAMNGTCYTLNPNAPMKYDEFKALPVNLQREYVEHLFTSYDASLNDIGEMFGITGVWLGRYLRDHLHMDTPTRRRRSAAHSSLWASFLDGYFATPAAPEDAPDEPTEPEAEPPAEPANDALLTGGSLTLTGTPKDVLTRLYTLFHDIRTPASITFTWELNPAEES